MINNKAKSPPASRQPGELMWNAGIYYMADGFTFDSTKPIVQWIIEKNLLPSNERGFAVHNSGNPPNKKLTS